MSTQTLGNNATALAISTPTNIDIRGLIEKHSKRKNSGVTTARFMLNHSKLFSACAAEMKSLYGQAKASRLDNETAEKLNGEIEKFIQEHICLVTPSNCIQARSYFHYNKSAREVTKRHQAVGEEVIGLKEQSFAMTLVITQLEKRLTRLQTVVEPDRDKIAACENQLADAKLTKTVMETKLAQLVAGEPVNG